MESLRSILESHLSQHQQLGEGKLGREGKRGGGPTPKSIYTEADKSFLLEQLKRHVAFSSRLIIAIVVLYFALFIASLLLVYSYRDPTAIALVTGGSLLSLAAIMRKMTDLWKQK